MNEDFAGADAGNLNDAVVGGVVFPELIPEGLDDDDDEMDEADGQLNNEQIAGLGAVLAALAVYMRRRRGERIRQHDSIRTGAILAHELMQTRNKARFLAESRRPIHLQFGRFLCRRFGRFRHS